MSTEPDFLDEPIAGAVAEDSLRRIAEAARRRRNAFQKYERAKFILKDAREAYLAACENENRVTDSETTPLPLFPSADDEGNDT